jgi:hypothetical protein
MKIRQGCKHPKWTDRPIEDPLNEMSKFDLPRLFAGECTQGDPSGSWRDRIPYLMERCVQCGERRMKRLGKKK